MANKTKKGGLKSAQTQETIEEVVETVKNNPSSTQHTTMDRNHQVDMLKIMHETFHPSHDPDAAAHTGMAQETVDKLNRLKALGIAVVFGQEVSFGNSDFAMILRKADLPELQEAMAEIGMKLDSTKLIESKENKKNGHIQVPSTAVEVSEETKDHIKKDAEATAAAAGKVYDPTKIANEDELKEALKGLLAIGRDEKLIESIYKAISFWLSYNKVVANRKIKSAEETLSKTKDKQYKESAKKSLEDAKNEVKRLNGMSNSDVFQEITKLTGSVGILCYGLANHIILQTASTGSPISAWCCLYSSSIDKKTGVCKYSYEELADIVKSLVKYYANELIAKSKKDIEDENALPEKDRVKAHIETANKNIKFAEKALDAIICAPSEFVDNLKQKYLEKDNFAKKTVICLKKAFYSNVSDEEMSRVKIDSLLDNCTQYAGVISNLFRDPGNQISGYAVSNADHLEFKTHEEVSEEKLSEEKAAAEAAEKKAKENEAKKQAGLKKKAEEEKKKQVKK